MIIAIVAATDFELNAVKQKINTIQLSNNFIVKYFTTGVSAMATATALTHIFFTEKPQLIIQCGIAGSYCNHLSLGSVHIVKNEYLVDVGVIENGDWKDVFDLQLAQPNNAIFTQKAIVNNHVTTYINTNNYSVVNAATVNTITTLPQSIQHICKAYPVQLESMEGAALHYVGNQYNIPYLQVRAISNYVGERNKQNWLLQPAIEAAATTTLQIVKQLNTSTCI